MRRGCDALVEQLQSDGVKYIFGNPGTVEQGWIDTIDRCPDIEYILTLQEASAVGIADGYARKSGHLGVVQLHSGVGLGNGIGMLYQALRGHTPMLILVGDAGLQYDNLQAQMAVDLVAMAAPVTKWATRVTHPDSVLRTVRRAIKTAFAHPRGPVLVNLPADVMDATNREVVVPSVVPDQNGMPDADVIHYASALLKHSWSPAIIAGDGVSAASAQVELSEIANVLGAPVWGCNWSAPNLPANDPHYRGDLGHMFGSTSQELLEGIDTLLVVGTYLFPEVYPDTSPECLSDVNRIIHIDSDIDQIGKNFPVDIGIQCSPKAGLRALLHELGEPTGKWKQRNDEVIAVNSDLREQRKVEYSSSERSRYLTQFGQTVTQIAPPDTVYFDEALTSSAPLFEVLPTSPGRWLQTRGGSLGVGVPSGVGMKLAVGSSSVVVITGDGGFMYTLQALWTASHLDISLVVVVCNNGAYELLKDNFEQYRMTQALDISSNGPSSFRLTEPSVDYVMACRSMGGDGEIVTDPAQFRSSIKRAFEAKVPYLIDLVIPNLERR